MRVPFTPEMIELHEMVKPYERIEGLICILDPDAPEEIKAMNERLSYLFRLERARCTEPNERKWMYEAICKKVGFDVDEYQPQVSDIEAEDGLFTSLTADEKALLTVRILDGKVGEYRDVSK